MGWTSVSISDARAARPRPFFDKALLVRLVVACGLVPLALLAWDALHDALGANDVNFAIRTTGLVGLVLLMLTLAVTPLRRLTGWAMILGARRALGLLAFTYLAVHFAIFFLWDREASVSSTVHEIGERTYLLLGFIGLVIMTALAATSTDRMVARLGAKRWKLLHRLVYVAAILGVVHFLLLVKSDIRAPRAFAFVLGALLLFRAVRHYLDLRARAHRAPRAVTAAPAAAAPRRRRFWTGDLRVARVFDETPDVRTFRLVPPDGGPLPFEHVPGQYLNVALDIGGQRVNRSYTIASAPGRSGYVEITVKRTGGGWASHHLHDAVRAGDLLRVSAPAGRFVFTGEGAERVLLIAGGVGVTPIMAVVRDLTDRAWPGEILVAFGVRRREDVIFADELAWLARRHPNLRVAITLSGAGDAWDGARGHVDEALLRGLAPDLGERRIPVLLCGPDAMMAATKALLLRLGVPEDDVATEEFVSPVGEAAAESTISEADRQALDAGAPASVTFARSGVTAEVPPGETILEAAEDAGLSLPYECRSGICGQCKATLRAGRVAMPVQDALTADERDRGVILACQARPIGACEIDA